MSRSFLANIPLVPILFALGQEPDQRGRFWCPFHNDQRPGGKPSAVISEDPTNLYCWSCGTDASAPEVVAEVLGLSMKEATRWCLQYAKPVDDLPRKRRREVSPARLEAELRRHTEGIRYPNDVEPIERFLRSRNQFGQSYYDYVRYEWGWRGDYHGRVVMPHRDVDGTLTGIKWRIPPDWRKLHRPGSRFTALYGSWRYLGHRNPTTASASLSVDSESGVTWGRTRETWVIEGETSTAWGGFWLEPLGVRVLGAVGAGHKPTEEHVNLLRGDKIFLVFDDVDMRIGREAVERWADALTNAVPEISVVQLAHGHDLCNIAETPAEVREKFA